MALRWPETLLIVLDWIESALTHLGILNLFLSMLQPLSYEVGVGGTAEDTENTSGFVVGFVGVFGMLVCLMSMIVFMIFVYSTSADPAGNSTALLCGRRVPV